MTEVCSLDPREARLRRFMSLPMDNPSSPEMFESDLEDPPSPEPQPSPVKLSVPELIARSDHVQFKRITKSLTGIPPPPKHTTCPLNCSEMLARISQNRQYFWTSYPLDKDENKQLFATNENSNDSAYPETDVPGEETCSDNSGPSQQNNSGTSDTFTLSSVSSNSNSIKGKELSAESLDELLNYSSVGTDVASRLSYEDALKHKTFGIQLVV